ncbi:MAG TPA: aldo/keto reductase [Rhizomicrobium sp.]|nr:aldo/keto reductase [Rhizomicrobium sp.]
MRKLGLGTVQFGQAYGISNVHGQVSTDAVRALLKRAAEAGIAVLDTAANYGEAEQILSQSGTRNFRIVTKTIGVKHGVEAVVARARQSARDLKADTLLVHAAGDLTDDKLWPALQRLKAEGEFRNIGISVYVGDDPAGLAARYRPDVMQLPFSILDQRLLQDGTLARLNELGVELHARSVFLQGLLFMDALPPRLAHAAPRLAAVKLAIRSAGSTPLAAALGFVLSRPEIGVALVGVTALAELEEILAAAAMELPRLDWSALALDDEKLLTPSRW